MGGDTSHWIRLLKISTRKLSVQASWSWCLHTQHYKTSTVPTSVPLDLVLPYMSRRCSALPVQLGLCTKDTINLIPVSLTCIQHDKTLPAHVQKLCSSPLRHRRGLPGSLFGAKISRYLKDRFCNFQPFKAYVFILIWIGNRGFCFLRIQEDGGIS